VSRRPQRAGDEAELAAEELTRTATANALVGASIAMLASSAGRVVSAISDDQPLWVVVPGVLFVMLGFGIWIGAGTKFVFQSRRIDALRAAA
jgi:hypothetical protein